MRGATHCHNLEKEDFSACKLLIDSQVAFMYSIVSEYRIAVLVVFFSIITSCLVLKLPFRT